jgi:hypothetical protein
MSRFITYTNTLALFGLNVMLHYEQLKSTKHWDNCLSHCKYRKLQSFKLIEMVLGQHYTLKMGKPTTYRDNSGWRLVDYLARNNKFYMRVGGDGDKTDVKTLDSTNYQQWAPKMKAYLMSKEL